MMLTVGSQAPKRRGSGLATNDQVKMQSCGFESRRGHLVASKVLPERL